MKTRVLLALLTALGMVAGASAQDKKPPMKKPMHKMSSKHHMMMKDPKTGKMVPAMKDPKTGKMVPMPMKKPMKKM